MPFRSFNGDHETFARELLGELAPQIREFMDNSGIKPDQELIRKKMIAMTRGQKFIRPADDEEEDMVMQSLRMLQEDFIQEIVSYGFQREDIAKFVNEGIWSFDRLFTIEKLNNLMY